MRQTSRAVQSIDSALAQITSSLYICPSCRHSHFPLSLARDQIRHASNKNLPLTEKIRRKIWGTDNPPGLKDPYGGPGFIERWQAERTGRKLEGSGENVEDEPELQLNVPEVQSKDYVPSTTWEGLEHIGGTGHWSESPPSANDVYQSYGSLGGEEKLTTREELIKALHQATVEILTHQGAGRIEDACNSLAHEDIVLSIIKQTKASLSENGKKVILHYPGVNNAQEIILGDVVEDVTLEKTKGALPRGTEALGEAGESIEQPAEEQEESEQAWESTVESYDRTSLFSSYPLPTDQTFLSLPLEDFKLRFYFSKRLFHLTGHRLPDPALTKATTLNDLLDALMALARPKPIKVADILAQREDLMDLPNLAIKDRRQTWVDKEQERGLWKVMEKEIRARGLPVPGEGWRG